MQLLWLSLAIVLALYLVLGVATIFVLRLMARRWRQEDELADQDVPYGPPVAHRPEAGVP